MTLFVLRPLHRLCLLIRSPRAEIMPSFRHECALSHELSASVHAVQGLDSHKGPDKIRVIYETKFRPVKAERPGAPPDEPSTSAASSKPKQATVTAALAAPTGRPRADSWRSLKGGLRGRQASLRVPGLSLRSACMQRLLWRRHACISGSRLHEGSSAMQSFRFCRRAALL